MRSNAPADLPALVRAASARDHLLPRGATVLVGVSGGPDSVALLHVLRRLTPELGLRLQVVHVDHGLRGEASAGDAAFVAALAEGWDLPLHATAVDTAAHARAHGLTIEEAARELRYAWFEEVAGRSGASRVALAHTLDDQAETVLQRLVRGAGGPGMLGMRPARPLSPRAPGVLVARPLLVARRAGVLAYCRAEGLAFREDASNADEAYTRNFLRAQVVPRLLRLNSGWHETLRRNLAVAAEEEAYLEAEASRLAAALRGDGWRLDRIELARWPAPLQRRALRQLLCEFSGGRVAPRAAHVEAVRELFLAPRGGGEVHLPGGLVARREGDAVRLLRAPPGEVPPFAHPWRDEGELGIPELGCRVRVERLAAPPADLAGPPAYTAYFAGEELAGPLQWRNWRPGDRIAAWGGQGRTKVARWLADRHMPRAERSRVLLLARGPDVLWIAGHRRGAAAPVGPGTRRILRVAVEYA